MIHAGFKKFTYEDRIARLGLGYGPWKNAVTVPTWSIVMPVA